MEKTYKTCEQCNKTMELAEFKQYRKGKYFLKCKKCIKINGEKKLIEIESKNLMKTCNTCEIEKVLNRKNFRYEKTRANFFSKCIDCINKAKRDRRNKLKEDKIKKGEIKVVRKASNINNKVCLYCDKELSKDMFRHNRRKCLNCERSDGRKYRSSDKGKQKSKKWVENNKSKMKELSANWYQNNKEKINKKYIEKYNNDINFKLHINIHKSIIQSFKRSLNKSSNRINKHLNCSMNLFKKWLQFCFNDDMTFNNHGEIWHFDHVLPVNLFDLTDDIQKTQCFSWMNYTPMFSQLNMSKHDNVYNEQLDKHLSNIYKFITNNKIDKYNEKYEQYKNLCATYLVAGNSLES